MHHFALGVEYDGSRFHGWQRQQTLPSVQAALETAISQVAATQIRIITAGRTDTGVHATGQVVSFAVPAARPLKAWVRGVNSLLPAGVAVRWARQVPESFNARFSARYRRYQYLLVEAPVAPAIAGALVAWSRTPLDVTAMHAAAQALPGEQDFSAVRAAGCESRTPMRLVHYARVKRVRGLVVFEIQANAFLQHMVRNIMGALLLVGRGQRPAHWLQELLAGRDRARAGMIAPASGLYLTAVGYSSALDFPTAPAPLFLRDNPELC